MSRRTELRTGILATGLALIACACTPPPVAPTPVEAKAVAPTEKSDAAATVDSPLAVAPPAPPGRSLAIGREFACALERVPGRVMCWGGNRKMQLGDGTLVSRATAGPVSGITDAVEVTAAGEHACARTASDEVFCWGESKPVARVNGLRDVTRVVADPMRTCVIHRDGGVSCWGLDRWVSDRLNAGGLTTGQRTTEPARKKGLAAVVDLALGFNHACMREASGALRCFGASTHGELGNASARGREYVVDPVVEDGLRNARAIGAGHDTTCAVRENGRVACWGANYRGAIGSSAVTGHEVPTDIPGIEDAVTLTASDAHVCALLTDGAVRCFGNSDGGKLGSTDPSPSAAVGLCDAIEIAVGPNSSCARRRTGGVVCWGHNDSGQLGNGELPGVAAPVRLDGIADAEDAASPTTRRACYARAAWSRASAVTAVTRARPRAST